MKGDKETDEEGKTRGVCMKRKTGKKVPTAYHYLIIYNYNKLIMVVFHKIWKNTIKFNEQKIKWT